MYKVELIDWLDKRKAQMEKELSKGIKTNEKELKTLNKGVTQLKQNYKKGDILPRKDYPKAYKYYERSLKISFGKTKLWVLKVTQDWRLIYNVVGDEVKVVSFILDSMDHKDYNKRFGFK